MNRIRTIDRIKPGHSLKVRCRWPLLVALGLFMVAGAADAGNRLQGETSPYLQRHADDPVDWHPWGEAALERAVREGKPIFLSIGYAACHWCRVMERESFADAGIAARLNASFINIKVDREERPDLDGHFMAILTALNGRGGWPLNLFLTPDLKPIHGGTYFPPRPAHGLPAFRQVVTTIADAWRTDRQGLEKKWEKNRQVIKNRLRPAIDLTATTIDRIDADPRTLALTFWRDRFDPLEGGIGQGIKFPQPVILSLFLRQAALANNPDLAAPALLTLDKMLAGGVRDQLGGAFHRYAIDRRWQVPHFEIMLYDNALLARVYLEAWQLTGRERYRRVTREILDDLLRRFRLPAGCFIASLDADSAGGEGVFYTWTEEEIIAVLGREDAEPFLEAFLDPFEGLVEDRSVLRLLGGAESLPVVRERLEMSRQRLSAARAERSAPARDEKILTDWNALMISALARAGAVLEETRYIEAARDCLNDLLKHSVRDGRLIHSRRGDQTGENIFLDDPAFLIQALLDLHEADFDRSHLDRALSLSLEMLDRFQPATGRPLQMTPKDRKTLIPPRTVLADGRVPAGNSVALVALSRLALLTGEQRIHEQAETIRDHLQQTLGERIATAPELLRAWDFTPENAQEVIIAGPRSHPLTTLYLQEIHQKIRPGTVLSVVEPEAVIDGKRWPMLARRTMLAGRPTAYVCRNLVCRLPVNTLAGLRRMLQSRNRID